MQRNSDIRARELGHRHYALMDYSDTYKLHTVAIYAVRFGFFSPWPIADLTEQLAGRPVDFPALRQEFAQVLRVKLPAYWALQKPLA